MTAASHEYRPMLLLASGLQMAGPTLTAETFDLAVETASGARSAGENAGPGGLVGMGMATGGMGLGGLQQPTQPAQQAPAAPAQPPAAPAAEDPVAVLKRAKEMLDAGLITQEDYDAAKAKALGL